MLCEDSLCRKLEQCKHDYAVASVWCGNMYSPPPPKRDTSVVDALNNVAQAIRETKQEPQTPVVNDSHPLNPYNAFKKHDKYKPNRRNNLYE